jgi:hypothetical protein
MALAITPTVLVASEEGQYFSSSFVVTDETEGIPPAPPTLGVISELTVTPDYTESGVSIEISALPSTSVTVTISGTYNGAFDQKYIEFKDEIDSDVRLVTNINDVPSQIFAQTHYHPDPRRTKTISYLVEVGSSSGIVTKNILNNWSNGIAIIQEINSRGVV